jgi:histidyl-tRNA synthetase
MKFQAIKGVRDILPPESVLWNRVEQAAREVFRTYGYGEIRLPIFEPTELFARAIGLETDIVAKEMYSWEEGTPIESTMLAEWLLNHRSEVVRHHRGAIFEERYRPDLVVETSDGGLEVVEFKRRTINNATVEQLRTYGKAVAKLAPGAPRTRFVLAFAETPSEFVHKLARENQVEIEVMNLPEYEPKESIALRPEATASVVRAYIEHGMQTRPGNVKLYYVGPMFRRERPQKGRYRQFYQIGAELLGPSDHPALDAEVIEMLLAFFSRVNLRGATLYINSIGDKSCRAAYVERLRGELQKVREKLGADSQRRIETNPLRVLDSKLPEEQPIIETLPRIADHLCDACREHYAELKRQLALRNIRY